MTLPYNWNEVKMPDVVEWSSGGTPKSDNKKYYNGDIPWLIIGDLNDGIINSSTTKITEFGLSNSSAKYVEKDSVLLGMYGSIGKLGIAGMKLTTNQAIAFTKTLFGINNKYLFYYLKLIKNKLFSLSKGGTQKNISLTVINSLTIPLPPFPEQNRIVAKIDSLFSELDNNVTLLKNVKTQLAIYRQSVLKWAFKGKLTEEWRKKNKFDSCETVLENVKIIKENERTNNKLFNIDQEFPLYDLPKEWKWVSIGNISKGVEYGTSAKSSKNGKIVVLRMGNIQNGIFIYNDLVYTSNKKEIEKYKLFENDVLFNRTNSPELVGKTALYSGAIPSIFAGYLIRLNQISYINAKYLTYFLNSPHAKECGNIAKTDGVNQSNINGTKLSSYPFPICSKSEQIAIVAAIESRLSVCDKIEQTIDQTLALSDQLRQSILKKAFEGRLVPQDPNDEPAEKLLERIKAEKAAILEKQKQLRSPGSSKKKQAKVTKKKRGEK